MYYNEGFIAQTGGTRAMSGRRRLGRWLEAFDFVLVTFRAQALLHRVAIETASILAEWRGLRLNLGIRSISVHCRTSVVEGHFLYLKEKGFIAHFFFVHLKCMASTKSYHTANISRYDSPNLADRAVFSVMVNFKKMIYRERSRTASCIFHQWQS